MYTSFYSLFLLDSERNEDSIGFIIVFFFLVYIISSKRKSSISTYSILYFSKLDQDGTLKRSFEKTTDKLQNNAKNRVLISNTLFTIETNKNNNFSYFVVIYNIISTYRL